MFPSGRLHGAVKIAWLWWASAQPTRSESSGPPIAMPGRWVVKCAASGQGRKTTTADDERRDHPLGAERPQEVCAEDHEDSRQPSRASSAPRVDHPDEVPVLGRLANVEAAGLVAHQQYPCEHREAECERREAAAREEMSARFASAPTREESHKQRRKEQDEAAVREQEYAGGQAVARESRERQRRPLCGVPDQPGTRKRLEDIE